MSEYDQTFDPNILIGHCDLISRFSDFALYCKSGNFRENLIFANIREVVASRK